MVRAKLLNRGTRLRAEFVTLYVALPVAFAWLVPPDGIWASLLVMLVVSAVLLACTSSFQWRFLWRGRGGLLAPTLALSLLLAPVAVMLPLLLRPDALFWLPYHRPGLWLAILLLYPLVSALPQELAYRALFFERYGSLFPSRSAALLANGLVFGLAHLFLWNLPAILLSVAGGVAFAWAYRERGSFPLAWLLHSLAGAMLFTTGAGAFLYHGTVG